MHRVCVCISAVLQQQKTNATKRKKKVHKKCLPSSRTVAAATSLSQSLLTQPLAVRLPACLAAPLPLPSHALHKLCGFAFVSLTLSHSLTLRSPCVNVCVCVCVCFCLRLLCAFNFQFTAVPKLYLKANFAVAVAVAVSLPALCSNSSSRRS